jgi:hypothetical protein
MSTVRPGVYEATTPSGFLFPEHAALGRLTVIQFVDR